VDVRVEEGMSGHLSRFDRSPYRGPEPRPRAALPAAVSSLKGSFRPAAAADGAPGAGRWRSTTTTAAEGGPWGVRARR
jgi:hypothetical protein